MSSGAMHLSPFYNWATSIGKLKHNDIHMHSHTRFRIRKLPKYVCDIYSWHIFYMSDVYVCLHETIFAVERLVPSLVILCLPGQRLWGPHIDTGTTAYTLATAYEGKYGIDFWTTNNIVPTETANIAYPIHLRRAARCVSGKKQC